MDFKDSSAKSKDRELEIHEGSMASYDALLLEINGFLQKLADNLIKEQIQAILKNPTDYEYDEKKRVCGKAFLTFCQEGCFDVVNLLLKNPYIIDITDDCGETNGKTALMVACENGHERIAELLIEHGSDFDERDLNQKKTALMYACQNGHQGIVNFLINHGVIIDTRDSQGKTALMYACETGDDTIVALLIKKGKGDFVNVDVCDFKDGMTPLMYACKGRNEKVVDLLLKSGGVIDVNAYDVHRNTVLMHACQYGQDKIVDILMENGASVEAWDAYGQTALMHACRHGHLKVVDNIIGKYHADAHKFDVSFLDTKSSSLPGELTVHILIRYDYKIPFEQTQFRMNYAKRYGSIVQKLKAHGISSFDAGFDHIMKIFEYYVKEGFEQFEALLEKHGVSIPFSEEMPNGAKIYSNGGGSAEDCVELMTNNNVKIYASYVNSKTALMHACENNHETIVNLLIKKYGVNVDGSSVEGKTPLMCSCEAGHETIAGILLNNGASINARDSGGKTAFMFACQNGHEKIIDLLLKTGADFNCPDNYGQTPFMYCCESGNRSSVELLIKQGVDVNTEDFGLKETALFYSSVKGHKSIIEVLLENGVDVNHRNEFNETALVKSCRQDNENERAVDFLLECGAITDYENFDKKIFSLSCSKGHGKTAALLIRHGSVIDEDDCDVKEGFLTFCRDGFADVVELMLAHGISGDGWRSSLIEKSPLMLSCEHGHDGIVELLLSKGSADINAKCQNDGTTALGFSCINGYKGIVDCLIKHGADINTEDCQLRTPLMYACKNGHEDIVSLLIEAEAGINAKDKHGKSGLIYACENGHTSVVDLLIGKGVRLDVHDNEMWTPFMYACKSGQEALIVLLIKHGAQIDANIKSRFGQTPFVIACENGHKHVVDLLLKHGVKIDGANEDFQFRESFFYACENGYEKLVKLLIKYNARIDMRGVTGWTPLLYACVNGHELVANMLIKHGAVIDKKENTELLFACRNGHEMIINLLIKQGIDINDKNNFQEGTALLSICENLEGSLSMSKQMKLMNQLIKLGIDINDVNEAGETALMRVILLDQAPLFDILINAGSNVNVQNQKGETAIMLAASRKNTLYLKRLLKSNANLELTDVKGQTVFAFALEGNGCGMRILLNNENMYIDSNKGCLKPLHKNGIEAKSQHSLEALIVALQLGVLEWGWCPHELFKQVASVAVESGFYPIGKIKYDGLDVPPLVLSFLKNDRESIRLLMENLYFFPEDFVALCTDGAIIKRINMTLLDEFTRQPLTLLQWSFLNVSKAVCLSDSCKTRANKVDCLSIPEAMKRKLKFER